MSKVITLVEASLQAHHFEVLLRKRFFDIFNSKKIAPMDITLAQLKHWVPIVVEKHFHNGGRMKRMIAPQVVLDWAPDSDAVIPDMSIDDAFLAAALSQKSQKRVKEHTTRHRLPKLGDVDDLA